MKVQSTFYIDFISKTVDVLLISSFITKQMPKLLIFDAFTLLICKKNVAIYALLRCKIFSLKIWLCKIFDKFHVWVIVIKLFKLAKEYHTGKLSTIRGKSPPIKCKLLINRLFLLVLKHVLHLVWIVCCSDQAF